jgi:hypothetical protein
MHIHFVEPRKRTNPLAEKAIESLNQATKSLEHSLDLVNELQNQLARVRSELTAYAASCMDEDAQIIELERMRMGETHRA